MDSSSWTPPFSSGLASRRAMKERILSSAMVGGRWEVGKSLWGDKALTASASSPRASSAIELALSALRMNCLLFSGVNLLPA